MNLQEKCNYLEQLLMEYIQVQYTQVLFLFTIFTYFTQVFPFYVTSYFLSDSDDSPFTGY